MSGIRKLLDAMGTNLSMLGRLKDGKSLAEIKNMNKEILEAVYFMAFNYYETRRLDKAEPLFMFLCLHNHRDIRFLTGLACCRDELGDGDTAIKLLKQALDLDHKNPHTLLALATAYRSLGNADNARTVINHAIKVIDKNPALTKERLKAEQINLSIQSTGE
ncbi:MAG: tetratricopeptide repeat protein [Endozoicomonadaceae bacterium]|nr:tetratricopeptide repeat protein [Endozoicomonadaceae bacterium]